MSKAKKMLKIRDIKYKEIEDNDSIIKLEKEETNIKSISPNKEISNDFADEEIKATKNKKNYFKLNEEDNLIADQQANMQILKEETNDSDNEDTIIYKNKSLDSKHDLINISEINFKKSNKSIIKNHSKEKNSKNYSNNKSISNIKSIESHDKNHNDEEYNKVFSSHLSENENK